MATNGFRTGYNWPVLTGAFDGPLPRLRKFVIPGTGRTLNLRDGSVGFLLVHLALYWHEVIHDLSAPNEKWDEWGWAARPVRGSSSVISEHAGGKAMDLDSTLHPRGVPLIRNLTVVKTALIRRRLTFYHGVIGWGGNYRKTVDGMHFEIANGVTLPQVETEARRLLDSPRGRRILAANPGLKEVILS